MMPQVQEILKRYNYFPSRSFRILRYFITLLKVNMPRRNRQLDD